MNELPTVIGRDEVCTLVEAKLALMEGVLERREKVGHVGPNCNDALLRDLEFMTRQIARCVQLLNQLRDTWETEP